MARIELNIVAFGDFTSVNNQIKALQTQVNLLNKSLTGVGVSGGLAKDLNAAANSFKAALLSSGQFTAQTVRMTSETEKFGKSLVSGKLKLNEYFNIITGKASQASNSLKALTLEQVKLQNSIVMADPTKRGIFSVFTPTQIDKVTNATKIARMQQNLYNLALEGGSKALINWGKNTQWAGRQLTVGLTMPMVIFGSTAAKTFQEVNDQLVRLQKVYGDGIKQPTQQALDSIREQTVGLAKDLASTMGIAAKDTAAMAADLAATGLQGKDLLEGTREAMRLAKLGELDQQAAMQATVSLQNVYKLSTNELSGAINFLNAVENQTSTSLQDLVDGIPRVGPIVQQLGGSFKDTAVMMVAMKEAGVPAAQAANAIKSGLASLINPTKVASDMFAQYNINLKGISESAAGNPIKMIMGLQQALTNLDPLVQARLIEQLFGKFQQARMQALITNLGAVNSQTRTAFELASASAPQLAAIAAQEMKIATESTTGKFKRAVESLKADLLPVGEKILQVATAVINFADKIASAFGALPGPVQSFLGIFIGGAAIAGPLIMLTGLMGNFAGYILKAIYNLRNLTTGATTFRELLTPELIASSNAATLFGANIQNDVSAVNLLNSAIQRLTVSMEAMVAAMSRGAGGLPIPPIPGVPPGLRNVPFRAPGMAKGGFVPGDPAKGDIYPAVLTGGEAVIPEPQAQKYAPFISALIRGDLGQHAYGIDPLTGMAFNVQRAHAVEGHGNDILDLMNLVEMLSGQGSYGLTKVNRVVKGVMMGMTSNINQLTKGAVGNRKAGPGASAQEVLDDFAMMTRAGIDPMEELTRNAKKLGADMGDAAPKLKLAYQTIIDDLQTAVKNGTMFGMNPGQVPLEQFLEQRLRPVLASIQTATGQSMDEITQNIIATRGEGRGRKGSSGQVFFREKDGSVVPINQSSIAPYLSAKDVHTVGGNVPGSIEGKAKDYNKAMGFADKVKTGIKTKLRIKSPSEVFEEEVGKPLAEGTAKGMEEGTPVVVDAAEKQIQEVIEKQEKRARLINKRMMLGSTIGIGAMMAGGMVSNIGGGQNPVANTAGSVLGNVGTLGMLASFSTKLAGVFPQLALAVGVATIAFKGFSYQIEKNREHNKQVESSLKSSSDVISLFGGTLNVASQANYNFNTGLEKTEKQLTQVQKNVEAIKGLDKNSPVKLVAELIKGMDKESSIIGTLTTFVSAQVASGLDPSKAKDLIDAVLTYAGKTQYLAQAQKNIGAATKDVSTATDTWLRKVYQANTGVILAGTKYSDLTGRQKALSDAILQVTNTISSSSTSFAQFSGSLQAMASDSMNTSNSINALASALANAGQLQASLAVSQYGALGLNMPEIQLLLKMSQQGKQINIPQGVLKDAEAQKKYIKDTYLTRDNIKGVFTKQLEDDKKAAKARYDNAKASLEALKAQNAGDTDKVKTLQKQKDLLDAQLKTLRQQTDEINKQQQFNLSQGDLENRIRQAQASGNFLEANLLRQEQLKGQQDYASDKRISDISGKSADLGEQIAALKQAAQDAKIAASNALAIKQAEAAVLAAKKAYDDAAAAAKDTGVIAAIVTSVLSYLGIKGPGTVPTTTTDGVKTTTGAGGKGTVVLTPFGTPPKGGKSGDTWKDPQSGLTFTYIPAIPNRRAAYWSSGNWSLPARQYGGPTFKDQMYLVGEKGPEFFVPSQNGTIIPNDISRSMMNSSNTTNEYALNLTFNGANMDPDDVARTVMDAIKRANNSNSVYTNRRINT